MALGNAANVVVRRTFIESVEENAADKAGPMSRGRACSDSMLDVNRKLADYGEEDCPDFQLEGLSDAETGPDADAAPQIGRAHV